MGRISTTAQDVYQYIKNSLADGISPSVREICADLRIKSTSSVHKILVELEQAGLIEKQAGKNRTIRLPHVNTVQVPVLGTVAAGAPILAFEDIQGYVPYTGGRYSADELFGLTVRGDSMIDAGILPGDVVIVRRQPVADNGRIVVAMIEDEATVKRLLRENGRVLLLPENENYEPIPADNAVILGIVVALIRQF